MSQRDDLFGHQHVTVITPPGRWPFPDLKEVWLYRGLLVVLAGRDIRIRYKQTVLGAAWAVIQPITTMVVFTLVFGRLAGVPSEGYPYPIFVYAGLLPWTFFANALSLSGTSLLNSAQLVSKVYFPRLTLPVASLGGPLLDFAISTLVLLSLMLFYRVGWTANLLAVPLLVLGVAITVLGVGSWLAAITVSYRDFRFVLPFLVQTWMFLTPVIYPSTLVPPRWQWLFRLNPMAGFVDGFRSAFLGKPFAWAEIGAAFLVATIIFFLALSYFGATERRFADFI